MFTHVLTGSCSPFYVLWLETEVVGIADSRARKIVLGKVPAGLNMRPSACKADTLKPMYYSSELLIKGWCVLYRKGTPGTLWSRKATTGHTPPIGLDGSIGPCSARLLGLTSARANTWQCSGAFKALLSNAGNRGGENASIRIELMQW